MPWYMLLWSLDFGYSHPYYLLKTSMTVNGKRFIDDMIGLKTQTKGWHLKSHLRRPKVRKVKHERFASQTIGCPHLFSGLTLWIQQELMVWWQNESCQSLLLVLEDIFLFFFLSLRMLVMSVWKHANVIYKVSVFQVHSMRYIPHLKPWEFFETLFCGKFQPEITESDKALHFFFALFVLDVIHRGEKFKNVMIQEM